MQTSNEYLNQVVQEQAQVQRELQHARKPEGPRRAAADVEEPARPSRGKVGSSPPPGINYRITGFWMWQTVVVPPNVYVVHTRRGHPEPLDIGLGISFRYNPFRDAFLV